MGQRSNYVLCSALAPLLSFAQPEPSSLLVTGVVDKADYCTQRDGRRVLRLVIGFEVADTGATTLVIPRISRLTATDLTTPAGSAYRIQYRLTEYDAAPANLYEAPGADPQFFDILQPQDRRRHTSHTEIVPVSAAASKPKRGTISPGEYAVHMTLNFGPWLRSDSAVDQRKWASAGQLVLGEVIVEPLALAVREPEATTRIGPPTLQSQSWRARWFRRLLR